MSSEQRIKLARLLGMSYDMAPGAQVAEGEAASSGAAVIGAIEGAINEYRFARQAAAFTPRAVSDVIKHVSKLATDSAAQLREILYSRSRSNLARDTAMATLRTELYRAGKRATLDAEYRTALVVLDRLAAAAKSHPTARGQIADAQTWFIAILARLYSNITAKRPAISRKSRPTIRRPAISRKSKLYRFIEYAFECADEYPGGRKDIYRLLARARKSQSPV